MGQMRIVPHLKVRAVFAAVCKLDAGGGCPPFLCSLELDREWTMRHAIAGIVHEMLVSFRQASLVYPRG